MNSILYVVAASSFTALSNLFIRKSVDTNQETSGDPFLMYRLFASALCILGIIFFNNGTIPFDTTMLFLGFIAGLALGVLMWITGLSVQKGPSALSFAILNSACILPPLVMALLFGAEFGHAYSWKHAAGALLVVIGIFWMSAQNQSQKTQKIWFLLISITFVIHALYLSFFQWRALLFKNDLPATTLIPTHCDPALSDCFTLMLFLTAALFQLFLGKKDALFPKSSTGSLVKYGIVGGLINGVGGLFMLRATECAVSSSEKALLFPLYCVGLISLCNFWGKFLYKEKINWPASFLCFFGILISLFLEIQRYRLCKKLINYLIVRCKINTVSKDYYQSAIEYTIPVQNKAATKIQAFFRGEKTRQRTVLPNQLLPFFKEQLITRDLDALAKVLCREINLIINNPHIYQGKSFQFTPLLNAQSFPSFNSKHTHIGKEDTPIPYECWLELSSNAEKINLLVISKYIIGLGGFKRVNDSLSISLEFKLEQKKRLGSIEPSVVSEVSNQKLGDFLLRGIAIQNKIIQACPGAKIISTPILKSLDAQKTDRPALKFSQEWYNSDFYHALQAGHIPKDKTSAAKLLDNMLFKDQMIAQIQSNPSKFLPFTLAKQLTVISEVAKSLSIIHEAGFVHRDIKDLNIFIKYNPDNSEIEGFLADFDLAQVIGESIHSYPLYPIWDKCSQSGIVTPYCDFYGLAMVLGKSVILDFDMEPNLLKTTTLPNAVHAYVSDWLEKYPNIIDIQGHSTDEVCAKIDKFIKTESPTDEEQLLLENLKKEVTVIGSAVDIIGKAINTSEEMKEYLDKNEDLKLALTKGTKKEKKEVMRQLYIKFPYINKFISTLESLKQLF